MSEQHVWVIRQGCKKGLYLWGFGDRYDEYRYGLAQRGPERVTTPEWGEQGGATRYTNRVAAFRDAKKANGRIVKLVPRTTSAPLEDSEKAE